jgi:large subunit ribosomal protein L25
VEVTIQAEPRSGTGKGVARKLRAVGKVPGVLYGRGLEPVALAVDARTLGQALHTDSGRNVLIDLHVDGENHLTLLRELQRDPVRGTFFHVDFLKIARDVAIQVEVPIHIIGESQGVKEGGVIEHHIWNVRVECLPGNVPERIDAEVTELAIGDALRVSDLVAPSDVTILTPPEETVLSVVVPQKPEEVAPPTPEEAEAAELAAAAEGAEAPEGAAPEETEES